MPPKQYQSCINACNACAEACIQCAKLCQKEPNSLLMQRCIALNLDCAEFCWLAAAYMTRDSEFCDLIREDCAEICAICAEECAKHSVSHCQKSAEACRQCVDECLNLIVRQNQPAVMERPLH